MLTGLEISRYQLHAIRRARVADVTGLTSLRRLGLEQTSITDKGMEWVGQLPKTRIAQSQLHPRHRCGICEPVPEYVVLELKLDRTDLTDKSLSWLTGQKNLKYLDLYHTLVTEQGFQALKNAQPKTEVNWSLDAARTRRRT